MNDNNCRVVFVTITYLTAITFCVQNWQTNKYLGVNVDSNKKYEQPLTKNLIVDLRRQSISGSSGGFSGGGGSSGNSGGGNTGGSFGSSGGFGGAGGSSQSASNIALDASAGVASAFAAGIVGGAIGAASGGSSGTSSGSSSSITSASATSSSGNTSDSLRLNFDQVEIPEVPIEGVVAASLTVFIVYLLKVSKPSKQLCCL